MKYRVGDSGKIACVIRRVNEAGSYLDVTISLPHNPTHTVTIEAGDLLDYTPRAIQVGDYVTKPDGDVKFKVIAIDGGTAWVREPFGPNELVRCGILAPWSPPC